MSKEENIDVKKKILQWMAHLESDRKCTFTNAVCKIVDSLDGSERQEVVELIAHNISLLLKEKDSIENVFKACNVMNGCFDNFPAAVEAIDSIFEDVVESIEQYLKMCREFFCGNSLSFMNKMQAVDLTHVLSRLGTLILKLRRSNREENLEAFRRSLHQTFKNLSESCSKLICYEDDIAVDSKINLAMVIWLLKEITSSFEQLVSWQEGFRKELFPEAVGENSRDDVVKFMMAAAAVNLWPTTVISESDCAVYLQFFLSLCRWYSEDTQILLMTCRSLRVLAKHKSFCGPEVISRMDDLFSRTLRLIEHPVACVRHSGVDLLHVIVKLPEMQKSILSQKLFSGSEKSGHIVLAALAMVIDSREIMKNYPEIQKRLVKSLRDPTSVTHVTSALESLALHDSLIAEDSITWCEEWVKPLLDLLPNSNSIIAGEIEKTLVRILKEKPVAVDFILEKLKNPETGVKLFKIINKLNINDAKLIEKVSDSGAGGAGSLLQQFMTSVDDDIRLSAFSLVAEGPLLTEAHLDLVVHFLKYNLNNHRPATRQKVISLFSKCLTRINICYLSARKPSKNSANATSAEAYVKCLSSVTEICYSNIFPGANFNRLSTVLSILNLCQGILDPILIDSIGLYHAARWPSLLTALASTYEENKVMAVKLTKKLPFEQMEINDPQVLRFELRKAFGMLQELEPPTVLLGSYLLLVLLSVPSAAQVLKRYFKDGIPHPSEDRQILCIQVLSRYLSLQLKEARESQLNAARQAPMYGTMFAIRLIFQQIDQETVLRQETKTILQQLVEYSFEMADIVSPVVNNSSPEGHLPMDFQRMLEEKKCEEQITFIPRETLSIAEENVEQMIEAYKRADSAELKLKLSGLIRDKVEELLPDEEDLDIKSIFFEDQLQEDYFSKFLKMKKLLTEYECYNKFFQGHLPQIIEEKPVTAQALLLYSWRSMKEACLYLGDLVSKIPLQSSVEENLLTVELVTKIGLKLRLLLSEIKHRGAFEQADVGFSALCLALWSCPIKSLQTLPSDWLEEVLNEIVLPPDDQTLKFTSTRRSAGLPFLVRAIIATEVSSNYSNSGRLLQQTIETLLTVAQKDDLENLESRLHAYNILRALFIHAPLKEFVMPYVSRALQLAIIGSRSPAWPERNCCNLLFSALVTKIFGVARSRDHVSKKNKMTSKVFFQRFPDLYQLFRDELSRVFNDKHEKLVKPESSLYLILLLMCRLYPPSTQDDSELDLSPFVSAIVKCAANPIVRIRVLAAQAIVPFLPPQRIAGEIQWRLDVFHKQERLASNLKHGLLLQVVELLEELRKHPDLKKQVQTLRIPGWMMEKSNLALPLPILSTFVHLIKVLCRHYPENIEQLQEIALKEKEVDNSSSTSSTLVHLVTVLSGDNADEDKEKDWQKMKIWASNKPGVDHFLASLLILELEAQDKALKTKDMAQKSVPNYILNPIKANILVEDIFLNYLYFHFVPVTERDEDWDISVAGGMIQDMYKEIEKGIMCYSSKDIEVFLRNCERHQQQRRMRGLVQARVLLEEYGRKTNLKECNSDVFKILKVTEKQGIPDVHISLSVVTNVSDAKYWKIMNTMENLLEGDRSCRLTLSAMLRNAAWSFVTAHSIDFYSTRYWLLLFKLLLDEDECVRNSAQTILHEIIKLLDGMEVKEVVVPLAAQETALKCFIKAFNLENGGCVALLILALMTVVQGGEEFSESDPLEIFKRGNPNPFNETLALTRLFIEAAQSFVTVGCLEQPFPGVNTSHLLHIELAPHFARYGLRLKEFTTALELLHELKRIDVPDNAENDVFWNQVQQVLKLLST